MLEFGQHVPTPAVAEGLCKMYNLKPSRMLFFPLLLTWIQMLKKKLKKIHDPKKSTFSLVK